jgi:hypothetical protein
MGCWFQVAPCNYTLGNDGKTPAVNAEFFANLIPFMISGWPADKMKNGKPEGPPEPGTNVAAELKKLCANVKSLRSTLGAMQNNLLFRDKKLSGRFNMNASPQLFKDAANNPLYSGNLVLLVCAIYGSTLNSAVYETAASYAVFRNDAKIDLKADKTPVVISDILLVAQPGGGAYASWKSERGLGTALRAFAHHTLLCIGRADKPPPRM